jgi:hypothetical protein
MGYGEVERYSDNVLVLAEHEESPDKVLPDATEDSVCPWKDCGELIQAPWFGSRQTFVPSWAGLCLYTLAR